ncbi:unnamed protein product [Owenia fusiformis]|uniref:Ig-like domain-containing protein n=1 Tax=Owenia fusiformis TaxID=6347 RepID=A0A8S4PXY2_OWEFU|nr:unnamed protein product [Owenia fusiformis]
MDTVTIDNNMPYNFNPVLSLTFFSASFTLTLFSSFTSGQNVVVIEGPKDRAVLLGHNAELTCHINKTASDSNHVVQWISSSARTGAGKPLTVNERVTANDMPNKFSVSTEKSYNLGIQNTDLDDAGKYVCNNVLKGTPIGGLEPQLVVLEPEPCSMPNISTYNESDVITFAWSVAYAGNRDESQKPTIIWTLNGIRQTSIANETTPGVFNSTFIKEADGDDDQKELKCSFSVLNIQQHCSTKLNIQFTADPSLGPGPIAGIVIGVLLGVLIVAVLLFYFLVWKKRRPTHEEEYSQVKKGEHEEPKPAPRTQQDGSDK